MDSLDRIVFPSTAKETGARKGQLARSAIRPNPIASPASEATKTTDGLKVAGLALAGLALIAVAGVYAYRKRQRAKPMTRLQHLKAQLGLSDADFQDLKANLTKLNSDTLKDLKKAAW